MPSSFIIRYEMKKREKILSKLFGFFLNCFFLYLREVVARYQNRFRQFHRKLDRVRHKRLDHKTMQSSRHCYSWPVVQYFDLHQMIGSFCPKSQSYVAVVSENRLVYLQFSAKLFGHIKIVWLLCIRRLLLCTPIEVIISISGHCMCLKYLFQS